MQRNPVRRKEDRIVVWWAGLLPQEGCALSDIIQKTVTKPQLGPQHLQLLGYTAPHFSTCPGGSNTSSTAMCESGSKRWACLQSKTEYSSDFQHLVFFRSPGGVLEDSSDPDSCHKDSHSSALGWGLGSVIHFYKISPEGSTMPPLWWQSLTQGLVLDPSFTPELLR